MSLAKASSLWADIERIDTEARKVKPGRLALTGIASVLYALGWLVGKVFMIAALAIRWTIAAIAIGWRDATARTSGG